MSERAELLFERALALPHGERAAFVNETCGDDPRLRDELTSLLEHADAAERFFGRLGGVVASPSVLRGADAPDETAPAPASEPATSARKPDPMVGRAVGRYRIVSRIGSGGMGTVYRAHDTRLDREIALKFLPAHAGGGEEAEERFLVEARAAAALEHPNVCTVHEIGETDDGFSFIAMALCRGESLRERLRGGAQPIADAVAIATQIARGLAAAHARGIVHRDVKPGNVMLAPDGTIKLLDFGLAKVSDATLTRSGMTLGTPAYMSPEQAAGDPVDHRTDLWSLGVVLYEMLTGRRPFRGGVDGAVIHAILDREPEPISTLRPEVPAELVRIVERLLRKNPAERYGSAAELEADLAGVLSPDPRPARRVVVRRKPALIAGAALLATALVAYLAAVRPTDRSAARRADPPAGSNSAPGASLAVLPFEGVGGDTADAYFGDGIADEIASALSKAGRLRVASLTSVSAYRANHDADVRDLGRRLGVGTVLEGRVRRSGDRMRLTVQLTSVRDGLAIWSDTYERQVRDVFQMQDEIARAIVGALRMRLPEAAGAQPGRPVSDPGTTDPEAYDLYLRGSYLLERRGRGVAKAVEYFERAIGEDTTYAQAYAGLAHALELMPYFGRTPAGTVERRATEAARRALALGSASAEAYNALALAAMHAYRWQEADDAFRRAIAADPGYAPAQYQYGRFLVCAGRLAEAEQRLRQARAVDPLSGTASVWLAYTLSLLGRHDDALAESQRAFDLDSSLVTARTFLAFAALGAGRRDVARAFAGRASLPLDFSGHRAYILAATGDRAGAADIVRQLESRPPGEWMIATSLSYAYLGLGDTARALTVLERASADAEITPTWIPLTDRMFDPLRGTERFAAVVRRFGLDDRRFTSSALRSP